MMALVRGVTAASILAGSMLKVSGSMSTKTGLAPRRWMTPAVAKKVKGEVMTSSPGPTSRAIRAMSRASVPEETPTAKRGAGVGGDGLLEGLDLGAHDEVLGVADFVDDGADLVADGPVLGFEVEHRDVGDHEGGSFSDKR